MPKPWEIDWGAVAERTQRQHSGRKAEGRFTRGAEQAGEVLIGAATALPRAAAGMVEAAASGDPERLRNAGAGFTVTAAETMLGGPTRGGATVARSAIAPTPKLSDKMKEAYEGIDKKYGFPGAAKEPSPPVKATSNEEWDQILSRKTEKRPRPTEIKALDTNDIPTLKAHIAKLEKDLPIFDLYPKWKTEHKIAIGLNKQKLADLEGRGPRRPPEQMSYPGELPLPSLSTEERMRLAREGGYTTPAYRGISGGWDDTMVPTERRVHPQGYDFFSAANPKLAYLYATEMHGGVNSRVQPLLLNTKDYYVYDAKGAAWPEAQHAAFPEARTRGAKGVVMHNVYDEPLENIPGKTVLPPQTVYVTWDPRTRKSTSAQRFDPTSPDILRSQVGGRSPFPWEMDWGPKEGEK